ncbi:hypothetical protein JL721_11157 [Aureococcus anophagefferens]|nr:hypothetical protein JL721_11157 [Aureococcus anophagefferens]
MQRKFYDPAAQELVSGNHAIHNDAAEYWGMIPPAAADPPGGGSALDVACGGGRNMANCCASRPGTASTAATVARTPRALRRPATAGTVQVPCVAVGRPTTTSLATDLYRVVEDLEDIGFVDVEYEVGGWHLGYVVSYPDQWLIVYARKPGPATEQRV